MAKSKTLKLNGLLIAAVLACSLLWYGGQVQAATISVASGTDTKAADGVCHLSEAIENINDQAQTHADCAAGTGNDVIQLPAGTITLTADLPILTRSVTVQGHGVDKTVIDGVGQHAIFNSFNTSSDFTFKNFKTKAPNGFGIASQAAKSLVVQGIEVDGVGATPLADDEFPALVGFMYLGGESSEGMSTAITIDGLYVHDLEAANAFMVTGVGLIAGNGQKVTVNAKNITVTNLRSADPTGQAIGVFTSAGLAGDTRADVSGSYENITIDNISGTASNLGGFGVSGVVAGGDASADIVLRNATIRNIDAGPSMLGTSAAVMIVGAGGQGTRFKGTLKLQNTIVADSAVDGNSKNCVAADIGQTIGMQGTATLAIESLGGNISDDQTCSDYFTHSTDQNNSTTIKDSLGKLGSHGGSIPTIPLLAGSPAINAGVCEGAPSKDARGISRPQGAGCDAGAFELEQAKAADPDGTTNASTGKKIYIEPPISGAVVRVADILPANVAADDSDFEYPLGLVDFTVDGLPKGSTQVMNLYFETDEKAENFVARKADLSKNQFSIIEGATLSNVTHMGKPAIKVSYEVTDGGELDLDGTADGSITDPVGLARVKRASLVNTGALTFVSTFLALAIIAMVVFTYVDYRKHKAPIAVNDRETKQRFASQYTYLHHLKVVTFPTLHYRFTIIVEKKKPASQASKST